MKIGFGWTESDRVEVSSRGKIGVAAAESKTVAKSVILNVAETGPSGSEPDTTSVLLSGEVVVVESGTDVMSDCERVYLIDSESEVDTTSTGAAKTVVLPRISVLVTMSFVVKTGGKFGGTISTVFVVSDDEMTNMLAVKSSG